jgi:hypothetical protein
MTITVDRIKVVVRRIGARNAKKQSLSQRERAARVARG